MIEVITLKLSGLLSLIKRLLNWLKELFRKEEEEEEVTYTREQFVEAVKELSQDPVWRARILKDALNKIKEIRQFEVQWINKDDIVQQNMYRQMSCGIIFSFGDGIYGLKREDFDFLRNILQQDIIKYVSEFTDCDNFATFFKGFADCIVGKHVVIYSTGLVLRPVEQLGVMTCICKYDYLLGGHGWNKVCLIEPITVEKIGSTEKITYPFTIVNYEPQSDDIGDRFVGGRCYMNSGGLPVIYGKKIEGGDG